MKKIVILGGGASGVFAAIAYAKKFGGENVLLIEGGDRILKKLSITGNGQCNLSNLSACKENYLGDKDFIQSVFNAFSVEDALSAFEELGVCWEAKEDGKVYPQSYQASSVVDLMRFELMRQNVTVSLNERINEINKCGDVFEISTNTKVHHAEKVVYALGGGAYPKLLTNATNFDKLIKLGHSINPILPALVQLNGENSSLKMLKGIKTDVSLAITIGEKVIKSKRGEIHFADGAISGPVTFSLSAFASRLLNDNLNPYGLINFLPQFDYGELLELLTDRAEKLKGLTAEYFFSTLLHNQIGRAILKASEISINTKIEDLSDDQIIKLMKNATSYKVKITGTYGMNYAQVSLGGVKTEEIDNTMQSKFVKNLYILGEALDVTGDCGGFNLAFCWSTAGAFVKGQQL